MENNKIDPVLEEVCADIADFTVGYRDSQNFRRRGGC